jgi:hypothetical protein
MIAKLSDCPTNLIVEMVPEAIPKWRLSTPPFVQHYLKHNREANDDPQSKPKTRQTAQSVKKLFSAL